MRYFRKLSGPRCYLSPVNLEDAERYAEWLNDPEVAVNLAVASRIISLARERQALERLDREESVFAIVDAQTDTLIGNCGLLHVDPVNRCCEFGIFIGDKRFWNRGYGEEATRLALDYAFNFLNLHNVMLTVYAHNPRARRCYEKAGFREFGRRRQARRLGGRAFDIVYMDILAEEFRGSVLDPLLGPGEGGRA